MKALFIGGTGTISTAIVNRLIDETEWEVWILNRGNRKNIIPKEVHHIVADIDDEDKVAGMIKDIHFDVVGEFIGQQK